MTAILARVLLALFFLLGLSDVGNAQSASSNISSAIVYTTAPKTFYAKLKNDAREVYEIDGLLTFTITEAKSDCVFRRI
jgi:hypothetical protein